MKDSSQAYNSLIAEPFIVRKLPQLLLGVLIGALGLGVGVVLSYRRVFGHVLSRDHEIWAQAGDYIGGVLNPIYALLALLALLLTIYVQLFELRQSTKELRSSAAALSAQNRSIEVQSFERAFFQMVGLHNEIVAAIDLQTRSKAIGAPRITRGRDCFRTFYKRYSRQAEMALRGDYYPLDYRGSMAVAYEKFHERNEHNVGHYFRNLYRILKFIAESDIPNKARYAGIVRAQLSTYELALLFYNGISEVGEGFPALIVQFRLFENLRTAHLVHWEQDRLLYAPEAFGQRAP